MKLSKNEIEEMAKEIRTFLIDNELWTDVTIYFNGKAFSTDDRKGHFAYNNPNILFTLEDMDPHRYITYVGDYLTMSFEGDLYGCMNYHNEYGSAFDDRITEGLRAIFAKRDLYYELGNQWNLSAYPN